MTIEKTVNQIEAYSEQMDRQLQKLAEVTPPPVTYAAQAGKPASSTDLLMSVVSDQLINAAERLNAVHQATKSAVQSPKEKNVGPVIDVTEYREVSDGYS